MLVTAHNLMAIHYPYQLRTPAADMSSLRVWSYWIEHAHEDSSLSCSV